MSLVLALLHNSKAVTSERVEYSDQLVSRTRLNVELSARYRRKMLGRLNAQQAGNVSIVSFDLVCDKVSAMNDER